MDFTEISLAVLYLLQYVKIPLKLEQMTSAFDGTDYTYIHIALSLDTLIENDYIVKQDLPTGEFYSVTVDGILSVSRLKTSIRGTLRQHLVEYCDNNFSKLNLESNISAYIYTLNGKSKVTLQAFDKKSVLSQIALTVDDYDEALQIKKNWEAHADDAIAALFKVLLQDSKETQD